MDADEFNTQYLPKLLSSISKEIKQKDFVLMGDFNIDLLNYSTDSKVAEFLDKMYSCSLLPLITHPTRISKTSQTLIDNIFSTIVLDKSKTGNITTVISDHFCQFISLPLAENTDNNKNKTNLLKVWQGIKSIINTKPSKTKQSITTLRVNDKTTSNKEDIAETMNKFFVDIPKKIESKIKQSKKDFKQYS